MITSNLTAYDKVPFKDILITTNRQTQTAGLN